MKTDTVLIVRKKFRLLEPFLNERLRRLWAASEAVGIGWGGITAVAEATGLSRATIRAGINDAHTSRHDPGKDRQGDPVRRAGGGRPLLAQADRSLLQDLEGLMNAISSAGSEPLLRWTCKSIRTLAAELRGLGHRISYHTVAKLLHELGYSLRLLSNVQHPAPCPDQEAQFAHINQQLHAFRARGQPVISADVSIRSRDGAPHNHHHDGAAKLAFPELASEHAIIFGDGDLATGPGWARVGVTRDTARFAAEVLWHWWRHSGVRRYPLAQELLVIAEVTEGDERCARQWETALQALVDDTGLQITVCHFPPCTSKWTQVEQRMLCQTNEHSNVQALVGMAAAVTVIGLQDGLALAELPSAPAGATDGTSAGEPAATIQVERNAFYGQYNYTISPRCTKDELDSLFFHKPDAPDVTHGKD